MKRYAEPIHDFYFIFQCLERHPVLCPVLFVLGTSSPLTTPTARALNVIKKWKQVDVKYIEGGHDIHITDPEKVASVISHFLLTQQSKI